MNNINESIMESINNLQDVECIAEMETLSALSAYYDKCMIIAEYAEGDSFDEIIQEGKIIDEATGKGKGESVIKRIALFIPRLFKALWKALKNWASKLGKNNENIQSASAEVKKSAAEAGVENITPSEKPQEQEVEQPSSAKPSAEEIVKNVEKASAKNAMSHETAEKIVNQAVETGKQKAEIVLSKKRMTPEMEEQLKRGLNIAELEARKKELARKIELNSKRFNVFTGEIYCIDMEAVIEWIKEMMTFVNQCRGIDTENIENFNNQLKNIIQNNEFLKKFGGINKANNNIDAKVHGELIWRWGEPVKVKVYKPETLMKLNDRMDKIVSEWFSKFNVDLFDQKFSSIANDYIDDYENKNGRKWRDEWAIIRKFEDIVQGCIAWVQYYGNTGNIIINAAINDMKESKRCLDECMLLGAQIAHLKNQNS